MWAGWTFPSTCNGAAGSGAVRLDQILRLFSVAAAPFDNSPGLPRHRRRRYEPVRRQLIVGNMGQVQPVVAVDLDRSVGQDPAVCSESGWELLRSFATPP